MMELTPSIQCVESRPWVQRFKIAGLDRERGRRRRHPGIYRRAGGKHLDPAKEGGGENGEELSLGVGQAGRRVVRHGKPRARERPSKRAGSIVVMPAGIRGGR